MILKVCVGSSCHLKDSYEVITKLKELINASSMESKIELQASFCHGRCVEGVTAKIEDCSCDTDFESLEDGSYMIHRLSVSNIDEVFQTKILPIAQ